MSHSTLIPHFLEPTLSKAKTDEGTTTQGGRGGRLEVEKEVAELMPEAQMEGLTVVETVPPPHGAEETSLKSLHEPQKQR